MTDISDDVLDRAVEAAAKFEFESMGTDGPYTWESMSDDDRSERTEALRGIVTAALGAVAPSIRAEPLRKFVQDYRTELPDVSKLHKVVLDDALAYSDLFEEGKK